VVSSGVDAVCALPIEADAVKALFDNDWDADKPHYYGKLPGDSNSYSHGSIGPHNVVLVHLAGMGKVHASDGASHCRTSYINIKLALVVGICGAVPCPPNSEDIFLGDVIVSRGAVQYDFGRQYPNNVFVPKDGVLEVLGRPSHEIRAFINKISGLQGRQKLHDDMEGYLDLLAKKEGLFAHHPGIQNDRLFSPDYSHLDREQTCEKCGCSEAYSSLRRQEEQQPNIHFGLVASGDRVMKTGQDRDSIAHLKDILAFEMEGAGVWDTFPCVIIKGACDYADSHKMKVWQRYAAATAAACMKAFLYEWAPFLSHGMSKQRYFMVFRLNPLLSNSLQARLTSLIVSHSKVIMQKIKSDNYL
jgi:nucleoside phosphorylase